MPLRESTRQVKGRQYHPSEGLYVPLEFQGFLGFRKSENFEYPVKFERFKIIDLREHRREWPFCRPRVIRHTDSHPF